MPPTYLLVSVSQPDFTDESITKFLQRFTSVNPFGLPLALHQLRLPAQDSFVACIPLPLLLTRSVAGVRDSFTWGQ